MLVLGTAFSLAFIVIARQRLPRLRPPPSDSVSTLFFMLAGTLGFLVVGTAFGASLMKHLQPEELRTQAAGLVGMVAASCGAILMDTLYRNDGLNRLGLAPKKLPRGMAAGVLWLILILPWVYWVTVATEAVIVHFHIQSPTMHEIFRVWDSPEGKSTGFRIVAIIAACVVAPFSEELLFRGLLQTLIVRLLHPTRHQELPVLASDSSTLDYERPAAVVPRPSITRRSLLAIAITAALFASIHRPWTIQPAIFVLAIGLGLAYEYLGNLWATITIHCLFNAANFIIFLKTH